MGEVLKNSALPLCWYIITCWNNTISCLVFNFCKDMHGMKTPSFTLHTHQHQDSRLSILEKCVSSHLENDAKTGKSPDYLQIYLFRGGSFNHHGKAVAHKIKSSQKTLTTASAHCHRYLQSQLCDVTNITSPALHPF